MKQIYKINNKPMRQCKPMDVYFVFIKLCCLRILHKNVCIIFKILIRNLLQVTTNTY